MDLSAINAGVEAADKTGVPQGKLLVGFADALLARDEAELARLRTAIAAELGAGGLREVASIASNFQRMVRIADSTGIPQDAPVVMLGEDLIEELDLRRFGSADHTPTGGAVQRFLGRLVRPLVPLLMRGASAVRSRKKAAASDR